ncbi:MAG: hypothetical protein ACI85O_003860 [Saprospiraceae bacterium]|jgi:hypothetical protein
MLYKTQKFIKNLCSRSACTAMQRFFKFPKRKIFSVIQGRLFITNPLKSQSGYGKSDFVYLKNAISVKICAKVQILDRN